MICGDAAFLLFYVSLADVDRIFLRFPLPQLAFKSLLFTPEISSRIVFVNGKHPMLPSLWPVESLKDFWQEQKAYYGLEDHNLEQVAELFFSLFSEIFFR